LIALGDFYLMLYLLMPLAIFMYSGVLISVVKLRISRPDIKREFNAPFPRAGPVVIVIFNFILLGTWLTHTYNALSIFLLGLILVFVGIPLYLLIKLQTDEKFVEKFFNRFSFFQDKAFGIWYTRKDIDRIVDELELKKNYLVLDFGCGSGKTTLAIARKVSHGTVMAVDISDKQLQKAGGRIEKAKEKNVVFVKEYDLKFDKDTFDAVSAIGVLEYINEPKKTIKKLVDLLKPGGRFVFLSFGRSLGIPAPAYLSSEKKIRDLFKGMPVKISVKKQKKKLTEYWFIWGEKSR
jgi:ubiquinone/menaquinone biosynthesis C-methylase UbiE